MSKVIPLGGVHRSASSLLSQIMSDPEVKQVAVFAFLDNGEMAFGHFECSRENLAFAGAVALQKCTEIEE